MNERREGKERKEEEEKKGGKKGENTEVEHTTLQKNQHKLCTCE